MTILDYQIQEERGAALQQSEASGTPAERLIWEDYLRPNAQLTTRVSGARGRESAIAGEPWPRFGESVPG